MKIIHHNSSEIGNRIKADIFGHDNKTITLHMDAIHGGVNTSFFIGNHMDARALAKMLTAAADAVDPPKQAEPAITEDWREIDPPMEAGPGTMIQMHDGTTTTDLGLACRKHNRRVAELTSK